MPAERSPCDVDRILLEEPRRQDRERPRRPSSAAAPALFCVSSKIMMTASSGARVIAGHAALPSRGARSLRRAPRGPGTRAGRAAPPTPPTVAPTRSVGVKTPPTPPEPIVEDVATILPTKSSDEEEERRVAAQDAVGALEAVAPDLRQKDADRSDDRAAERHRERRRELRRARRERLPLAQPPDEERRGRAREQADHRERKELRDRLEAERRDAGRRARRRGRTARRASRSRPRRPPGRRASSRRSRRRPPARRASPRSACCTRRRRPPPCRTPSGCARARARRSIRRESEDASAAPIWMIGPSRPSDPPVEMTAIDDAARPSDCRSRTRLRPSVTTSIICEIPCGRPPPE